MRTGTAKEHIFKGQVIAKNYIKYYQGELKGQGRYDLIVETTPKIWNNTIRAIREKILSDEIWDQIITDQWMNKKYYFICHQHGSVCNLIRWQEITSKKPSKL
jgi:hypothetical protein